MTNTLDPTQLQIDHAASFCTQNAAIDGWMPASKYSESWAGQIAVCTVHFPSDDIFVENYSTPDSYSLRWTEEDCIILSQGNTRVVTWLYP